MNGCLIEGMGCPGGCVAGAGTNITIPSAQKKIKEFVKASSKPLLLIELKWNKTDKGAIAQIKNNDYPQALKGYGGDMLNERRLPPAISG